MRNAAVALLAGLAVVSVASAQYPGAPLLDTAEPGEKNAWYGQAMVSAALEGPGYLGARGGYRVTGNVLLFADLGWTDALTHGLSIVPSDVAATVAEAGALWTLPLHLPVHLAVRASAFEAFVPSKTYSISVQNTAMMDATLSMKASGAAAQLVASRRTSEDLQLYGGLGVHFLIAEASLGYTLRPTYDNGPTPAQRLPSPPGQAGGARYERASELDLGPMGGVAYRVAKNVDAMAELSYVKGGQLSTGLRVAF